jgi:hypothetical protein
MPEVLMTATYMAALLFMSRSAAKASERVAREAAERAEKQQERHQDRAIGAQSEGLRLSIEAQRRNLDDQPAILRRDKQWPLQGPPDDVAAYLSRGGITPLTVFFAPPAGPAARAINDAAISSLTGFVRQAYGSLSAPVLVSNEWDIVAQRTLDDAAIRALTNGLPQHPFIVLGLRYPSPHRVEILAAYHPADGSSIGEVVRLADNAISLRELVADSVREECDAWNLKALPVAQAAGIPHQALSELLGANDVRNLQLRTLEDALKKASIEIGSLNLDGRYQSARLEEIVQPALEVALQLATAALADGHNLLVRGLPPRALPHLPPLVAGAPPALRASASHVLAVYRSVLQRAAARSPEVATFGLLQLAMAHAELGDVSAAAGVVEDALQVWASLRGLSEVARGKGQATQPIPARTVELLHRHGAPDDAPLVRMFTAALSQMRASSEAAALRKLAGRLEDETSHR